MRKSALLVATLLGTALVGASAAEEIVLARAKWLAGVQDTLFSDVKREFKTRYDGGVWARACRDAAYAEHLAPDKQKLSAFLFDRLRARKDAEKLQPLEKRMLVNAVLGMTESYLQGGHAFVNAGRQDCSIVLKGLRREFPR